MSLLSKSFSTLNKVNNKMNDRTKSARADDSIEYLRSLARSLQKENQTLLQQISYLQAKSIEDQRKLQQLLRANHALEDQLQILRAQPTPKYQREVRGIQIETLKRKHVSQVQAAQYEIKRLKDCLQDVNMQTSDSSSRYQRQISQLKLQLNLICQDRKKLQDEVRTLQQKISYEINSKNRSFDDYIISLNKQHAINTQSLQAKLQLTNKQRLNLQANLMVVNKQLSNAKENLSKATALLHQRQKDLLSKQLIIQSLRQDGKELRRKLQQNQIRLQDTLVIIRKKQEQTDLLVKQVRKNNLAENEVNILKHDMNEMFIRSREQNKALLQAKQQALSSLAYQSGMREKLQGKLMLVSNQLKHSQEMYRIKMESLLKQIDQLRTQHLLKQQTLSAKLNAEMEDCRQLRQNYRISEENNKKNLQALKKQRDFEVEKLLLKNSALTDVLGTNKQQKQISGGMNQTLRAQLEVLNKRNQLTERKCQKLKNELEQFRRRSVVNQQNLLKDIENQRHVYQFDYKKQLQAIRRDNDNRQHLNDMEIQRLKRQIQGKQREINELLTAFVVLQKRHNELKDDTARKQEIDLKFQQNQLNSRLSKHIYDIYLKRQLITINK